jgi:hypothetical protein
VLDTAVLIIDALYAGYAGVVYWRLRTSSELHAEIVATRCWVRRTPPFQLLQLVPVAVPAALAGSAAEATRTVAGEDSWPG